jgi:predicted amidohydrolase
MPGTGGFWHRPHQTRPLEPESRGTALTEVPTSPSTVRVRVVQVAYGDAEPVAERIARVAELVRAQRGADLVVLPELWAHGGFAFRTWSERAELIDGPMVAALSAAAKDAGAVVHAGSVVERVPDGAARGPQGRGLWNTSVLLGPDGGVQATYRKIHRFGFGEGEPVLMEAGENLVTAPLTAPDGTVTATLGLATCYDLRFPELFRQLLDAGSDVFVVPAAWPAARVEHWSLLGRARAVENQSFVVQCNTGGEHSGHVMGGRSQVVSPLGEVLAVAGGGDEVLAVDLDMTEVARYRAAFPVLTDRRLRIPALSQGSA